MHRSSRSPAVDREEVVAVLLFSAWCFLWSATSYLNFGAHSQGRQSTVMGETVQLLFAIATLSLFVCEHMTRQYSVLILRALGALRTRSSVPSDEQLDFVGPQSNPFARALIVYLALAAIAWAAKGIVARGNWLVTWTLLSFLTLGWAVYSRYVAGATRANVYGYFTAGLAGMWAGSHQLVSSSLPAAQQSRFLHVVAGFYEYVPLLGPIETAYTWALTGVVSRLYLPVVGSAAALCIAAVIEWNRLRRRPQRPTCVSGAPSRIVYRIVGFIGRLLMLSIFVVGYYDLMFTYLVVRYRVLGRAHESPILYLRAFAAPTAPIALGKIVLRVVADYGVLVALVHRRQPEHVIHKWARFGEMARVSVASDNQWRRRLSELMPSCSAVIIDRSIETDALRWEMEQAQRFLGDQRTITMQHEGHVASVPVQGIGAGEPADIAYTLDSTGVRQARRELAVRLDRIWSKNNVGRANTQMEPTRQTVL